MKVIKAAGAAIILLAALALPTLAADPVYATVTGHETFSSDANKADYWGEDCTKLEGEGLGNVSAFVLADDYGLVVVKAGSGQYANTLFGDASAGETVWADTNGDGVFNPGGRTGDKGISHIIFCPAEEPEPTPTPTPDPTATPTPTPTPFPSVLPTVSPTATPTVAPTATPEPTSTPEPTATPVPTPEPTEAPTPSPEPTLPPTDTAPADSNSTGLLGLLALAVIGGSAFLIGLRRKAR